MKTGGHTAQGTEEGRESQSGADVAGAREKQNARAAELQRQSPVQERQLLGFRWAKGLEG